jgi:Rrf2 family protein
MHPPGCIAARLNLGLRSVKRSLSSRWRTESAKRVPNHSSRRRKSRLSFRDNGGVRVSAKVDYALRATIELAASGDGPVKGERIAQAQEIPLKFLENILGDLRHAGIVRSQRGVDGGYWLARPADQVTVAEVVRAVEGPIANVRGIGPEQVEYAGSAERLREVWIAVRANLRAVLEHVTIADVADGELPESIEALAADPDAWQAH